jgi:hypothetical protein
MDRVANAVKVRLVERFKKTAVHFQTLCAERLALFDPIENGHRFVNADVVEIALGKRGDEHWKYP